MNPYVDGYIKTLNYQKILREMQRNNNLMKIKRNTKPEICGAGAVFYITLARGAICFSARRQLHHWWRPLGNEIVRSDHI